LRCFAAEDAAVELWEALGFVCCEALFGGGDRWAGRDGSAEGGDDGGYDVVHGGADFQAVQVDDVALVEGVVRVVDEVVGVVCEVLLDIVLAFHLIFLRPCCAERAVENSAAQQDRFNIPFQSSAHISYPRLSH
jgi:hypothetical protein